MNALIPSQVKDTLERKLNHIQIFGNNFVKMYPSITYTERAGLFMAFAAAVKQVKANMVAVRSNLKDNLVDKYKLDYIKHARNIENLLKVWEEEMVDCPVMHIVDDLSFPSDNPDDIMMIEDANYGMMMDQESFDFHHIRLGLIQNNRYLCLEIQNGLKDIAYNLRQIVKDHQELKNNWEMQELVLSKMENQYKQVMWDVDLKRLINESKSFVYLAGRRDKETYMVFQEQLKSKATDPHLHNPAQAELIEFYLNGGRPAEYIILNKDKLTFEDISSYFYFKWANILISQHIEASVLTLPAEARYNNLFVNISAQEFVHLLVYPLSMYVDFRYNYQYAVLQMAMMDLGLIYKDRTNSTQMRDFINTCFLKSEVIEDQTTLTKWTRKLLGIPFGFIDDNNIKHTNLSREEWNKIKDLYWLCLSIINKVMQVDLKEKGFASYLFAEHPKTPIITDYKNNAGESVTERLFFLKSVLEGKNLLF